MNLIKNFVQKYDSISDIKNTYSNEEYTIKGYLKHIFVFSLICAVFYVTGTLFNLNENLNYLAYSLNAAIFGSFFFIYIEFEEDFKKQIKKDYNTYTSITIKLCKLLVIQLSITTILFFFIFSSLVSNIEIIILMIITITLLTFITLVWDKTDFLNDVNNLKYSQILYISLYYIIGFRVYHFFSITHTVLLFTGVLLLLLLIRQILNQSRLPKTYNTYIRGFGIIMLILGLISQTNKPDSKAYFQFNKDDRETFYIGYVGNVDNDKRLELPKMSFIENNDQYYGFLEGNVYIFDKYFDFFDEKITSPDSPFDNESVLYVENNKVYLESIKENERRIYLIKKDSAVLEQTEQLDTNEDYIHSFDPNNIKTPTLTSAELDGQYIYINSHFGTLKYSKEMDYISVTEYHDIDYDEGIFESNGSILKVTDMNEVTITTDEKEIIIESQYVYSLWQYYYYNDSHYINTHYGEVFRYDNDGNLIEKISTLSSPNQRIIFVDDHAYLFYSDTYDIQEKEALYKLSLNDLVTPVFKQRTNLFIDDVSIFDYSDIRMNDTKDVIFEFSFVVFLLITPIKQKQNGYN